MQNPVTDEMLFWKNAVPLNQAALAFAPKHLKEKWQDLENKSALSALKRATEQTNANANESEVKPTFLELLQPMQNILSARSYVLRKCEQQLCEHLKSGALRAFAFEAPRSLASAVLKLSTNTWQQPHRLASDEIKFEGITYLGVKIISANRAATLLKENLSQSPAIKAGRPSFKADLELAFKALLASGAFNLETAIKPQISTIREWMIVNTPNPKYGPDNPGYDLIRRTIKPLIEAEQKRQADKL